MDTTLACESFRYNNEEQWFELILKCTEFPSVNSAHGINTKTNVVYDQPWLVRFKNEIKDQLTIADPRKYCPWITDSSVYYIATKFILNTYFNSRDLDNLQKYMQDRIAEAVFINDARIIEVHQYKAFRPGDYEYGIVRFGISNYDYNEFR